MISNEEILGTKLNWEIFCRNCNWVYPMKKTTYWKAKHALGMYQSLVSVGTNVCGHQLDLREVA